MTIVEKLENYAKRSLAHQLTYAVAHNDRTYDKAHEIFYERAADASTVHTETNTADTNATAPNRDAGVVVFESGVVLRLYDIFDDTHGYGIGTQTSYGKNNKHRGEQRNWYRNYHRELTDAQWREHVTKQITQNYDHSYARWPYKVTHDHDHSSYALCGQETLTTLNLCAK